jgi:hypothetical protein
MTLLGSVKNGQIELESPCPLPDGTRVEVELRVPAGAGSDDDLSATLLKYAGKAVGLPADAARQHDHYLYGTPKK